MVYGAWCMVHGVRVIRYVIAMQRQSERERAVMSAIYTHRTQNTERGVRGGVRGGGGLLQHAPAASTSETKMPRLYSDPPRILSPSASPLLRVRNAATRIGNCDPAAAPAAPAAAAADAAGCFAAGFDLPGL